MAERSFAEEVGKPPPGRGRNLPRRGHPRRHQGAARVGRFLYEDKLLRELRVERLKSPRAYSQQPPSRALHLLQTPTIESSDVAAQRFVLRTPFHYTEAQGDKIQTFVGTAFHRLVRDGEALHLALKRVDLLNGHAALPAVQLFI
jgi:3-phenylpropionate/cinnamic acid dioxygenase small subunit